MPNWLRLSIRVLATIEAVDALWFLSQGGWLSANPWLVALTAGAVVGLALVWLAGRLPGPEWLHFGLGALLVAVAPAVLYPLSALLLVAGLVALAFGVIGRARRVAAA